MARQQSATPFLAHPVYLDVPMMVSFLAALDDGVAYSSEVAEKLISNSEREGEGGGKIGLPSLAQWLGLSLTAEGRYRRRSVEDESVEARLVREHTSASLFNILRQRILATGGARALQSSEDISAARVGDIVEVRGTIMGDPLRRFIDLISVVAPYVGIDLERDTSSGAGSAGGKNQKGSRPTTGPASAGSVVDSESLKMLKILKADVAKSTVVDLSMSLPTGETVVLTASNEYITDAAVQYMLAGSFTALGKVTQIIGEGESISLLRRTVFSVLDAAGQSTTADAFGGLAAMMPGMNFSMLAVNGPGLQILPLSVFV